MPRRILSVVFDRSEPQARFEIFGTDEQIYQKFLAVLQAMGWEPPTPTGISAAEIKPGPDWYEVVGVGLHDTLKVGDNVQMVQTPSKFNDWLYRSDGTLHHPQDDAGNYVTLIGKPLPVSDAPAPTPIQFNINDSVKVRLTDYGRDIFKQEHDVRLSCEEMDSKGYTKFQLWELMNIFGPHIYNGATRQCFDANIILFDSPQP